MYRSMLVSKLSRRSAFTLIELMIVVVIVAILAMIAIPMYRGSLNDARMAEGISGVGTIHTACRVKMATNSLEADMTLADLGFQDGDLDGKYFSEDDYTLDVEDEDSYTISVELGDTGLIYEINQDGDETANSTFTTE